MARVTYTFPFWLLRKMIDICLATSKDRDPYLNLTVRAIVPLGAEIFCLTRLDDRVGLEKLFSSGGARPNDLSPVFEQNALFVCLKFLVRANTGLFNPSDWSSFPHRGPPLNLVFVIFVNVPHNHFDASRFL